MFWSALATATTSASAKEASNPYSPFQSFPILSNPVQYFPIQSYPSIPIHLILSIPVYLSKVINQMLISNPNQILSIQFFQKCKVRFFNFISLCMLHFTILETCSFFSTGLKVHQSCKKES
jgi:hypothetical protein